jgi:signal transduction histidine kinase
LKNVEQHARARHVTVQLTTPDAVVQLVIRDDGIGFHPEHPPARRKGRGGLGLLSMRERAIYSGGALKVKSIRRHRHAMAGTAIEVRLPLGKARAGGIKHSTV